MDEKVLLVTETLQRRVQKRNSIDDCINGFVQNAYR